MTIESKENARSAECVFSLTDTHSLGIVAFVARLKDLSAACSGERVASPASYPRRLQSNVL